MVNGEQRKVHALDVAFLDGFRRQVHTSDAHARPGASGRVNDIGDAASTTNAHLRERAVSNEAN